MNDVIARYLDCWNETDPVARRKAIEEVWAADAEYIDPLAEARGRGLGPEGGESLVEGFDVAVMDEKNKITAVLGFLDKVPA